MEEKDFIKYWIWLTQIPYVGSVMEGRLLAKFKSPQDIYDADEKCLREISEVSSLLLNWMIGYLPNPVPGRSC